MRKGIATETIFYIVVGIVVVGLLVTLVVNYTGTARGSSDCKLGEQRYCEQWEANEAETPTDTKAQNEPNTKNDANFWNNVNGVCDANKPTSGRCTALGYDLGTE